MRLVEIFDDRQRLRQQLVANLERRHQSLRVDPEKLGSGLVAPAQVDEGVLVIELFEIEGDAHAKRGGGSKIAVELHGKGPSQDRIWPRRYSALAVAERPRPIAPHSRRR